MLLVARVGMNAAFQCCQQRHPALWWCMHDMARPLEGKPFTLSLGGTCWRPAVNTQPALAADAVAGMRSWART